MKNLVLIFLSFCYLGTKAQGDWQLFNTMNSGIAWDFINKVKSDRKGNVWAVGQGTLSKYNGSEWKVWSLDTILGVSTSIRDIDFDQNNNAWLATSKGVVRFNQTHLWTIYNTSNSAIDFNSIQSIEVCQDGTVWCGASGLEKIARYNGASWVNYVLPWVSSGTGNSVHSIDSNNSKIWLSWGNQLFAFDGTSWDKFDHLNSPLNFSFLGEIEVDSIGKKWMVQIRDFYDGSSGMLLCYDDTTWKVYDSLNCFILGDGVYKLALNGSDVWLGSPSQGVFPFDGHSCFNYNTGNSILPTEDILDIFTDRNKNILIGTKEGLVMYNPKKIHIGYPTEPHTGSSFGINIYPNPAANSVYFTWDDSYQTPEISIYNMQGQMILNKTLNQQQESITVRSLSNGIYNVIFRSGEKTICKKMMVQRE